MKLTELNIGESGYIVKIGGSNSFRKRLTEMGFVRGQKIESLFTSPLGNPTTYSIMGYELSLRGGEASVIEVSREPLPHVQNASSGSCGRQCNNTTCQSNGWKAALSVEKSIDVVLIGNPNSGKTSLFNAISGGKERVGNYSGVTVTQKIGHFHYNGYKINIIDLPGTYSLSAYSAEERYVQHYLRENHPDVVINVISASNIKRHLYLTTDLLDRDVRMIGALNMYDELLDSGSDVDVEKMSEMLGMPLVPVIAKNATGTKLLLDKIIELTESRTRPYPHIEVNYGEHLEKEIGKLMTSFAKEDLPVQFPLRYWALRMLEQDEQVEATLSKYESYAEWCEIRAHSVDHINREDHIDIPTEITSRKYLFIDEILSSTLIKGQGGVSREQTTTAKVDNIVTNKWLGFPIFIFLMWLTFSATFTLGAYPQEWIEIGVEWLAEVADGGLSDGWFKSFVMEAVIGGAGGVLVFLPNIVILYLFIVILEASGYMVRAAFIMDRLMRHFGLDGHAFIPMLMGFGCNVPAIMATRTIEDSKSRLISILINPFVSCSARLPVFILMIGTFLPEYGALAITGLYLLGIVVAVITAIILRKFVKIGKETALILEFPPYRMPTMDSILKQLWQKSKLYVTRIGKIILLASAIIWMLDYFPAGDDESSTQESYLSQVGRFTEPIVEPLGLDWRASVSLLTGVAAKEIVVSTMGVLYSDDRVVVEEGEESVAIADDFTIPSAIAFMIFVLLYFPCTGTLAAIKGETNSWRWVGFSILYSTSIAWTLSFVAYHIVGAIIK